MSIDGELRAVRAVSRQMRGATRPPDPRRLSSWARSLDEAVRGLERGIRFLRDGGAEPLSVALPPEEAGAGTDRPAPDPGAAQRRRQVAQARAERPPNPGTAGRVILDAVAEVARNPRIAGLTDLELAEITRLSPNTVRPRRGELVTGGWLLDSGSTRLHHGKAHRVWVLSDKAAREITG